MDLATTITRGGSQSPPSSRLSSPTSTSLTSTTPETPEGGATDYQPLEVFKRELEEKEEARRVITTLFQMRNLKEHGETIQKFITEVLLRDEKQKSMFFLDGSEDVRITTNVFRFSTPDAGAFQNAGYRD